MGVSIVDIPALANIPNIRLHEIKGEGQENKARDTSLGRASRWFMVASKRRACSDACFPVPRVKLIYHAPAQSFAHLCPFLMVTHRKDRTKAAKQFNKSSTGALSQSWK